MTNLEFDILETIHNQPFQEAHRKVLFTLENYQINIIKSTIDDLLKLELIEQVPNSDSYRLSKDGLVELKLMQLEKKHDASMKKVEFRENLNTVIAAISLLLSLITLAISLLD